MDDARPLLGTVPGGLPSGRSVPTSVRWTAAGLEVVDQTLLPSHIEWIVCRDVDTVVGAIKRLRVRGAPAIGIAGA